jgi:hypothetical protein
MEAHLKQIHRVNPKVNAIVTLAPEDQLLAQATAADEALAKGQSLGPLHGLPVAVKDLHETAGMRKPTSPNSASARKHLIRSSAPPTILTTSPKPAAAAREAAPRLSPAA